MPTMETIENGKRSELSKVIVLDLHARKGAFFTQEDLLEERMLTHDADEAIRRRDRKRELLRFGLMHGAKVEPGPLKAKLRYRLNGRSVNRRERQEDAYAVLRTQVLQLLAEFGEIAFNFLRLHLDTLSFMIL